MRIAQISTLAAPVRHDAAGSVECLVWLLTREMAALGHQVTVFGTGGSEAPGEMVATLPGGAQLQTAGGERPGGYSFPSGHASTAVAGAYALTATWPAGRILCWVTAGLVIVSRAYLGVHYPTDLLGGALLGGLALVIGVAVSSIFPTPAARLEVNEVPAIIRSRLLSLRGYDSTGMMLMSDVVEDRDLEEHLERFFADPLVEYIHIHNARPGCYNCRVDRVR